MARILREIAIITIVTVGAILPSLSNMTIVPGNISVAPFDCVRA